MFWTVSLSLIRSLALYKQHCWLLASKQSAKPIWHIPIAVCTVLTPDDGQRNCPKHVEFYSKNKIEKSVHLVGFIIRMLLLSFVWLIILCRWSHVVGIFVVQNIIICWWTQSLAFIIRVFELGEPSSTVGFSIQVLTGCMWIEGNICAQDCFVACVLLMFFIQIILWEGKELASQCSGDEKKSISVLW